MAGTKDKLAGKAKQVEGKITGDKAREAEGKDQEDVGKAKAAAGEVTKGVKRAGRELTR